MSNQMITFLLEAMSPCTESFFSRSYTYDTSNRCFDDSDSIIKQLEKCRNAMLEAVVWVEQTYVGGTWFDVTNKKWTAEFYDLKWSSQETCPTDRTISFKYITT